MEEKLQLEVLKKSFPEEYKEIETLARIDNDFRKLCADFIETVKLIKYYDSLLNPPLSRVKKEMMDSRKELETMAIEIKQFLNENQ